MTDLFAGMYNQSEFLEHYGVRGMKWGVRRNSTTISSDAAKAKKIKARKKKHGIDNLSNADIQKVVKRRELEKKYSELNPNKVKQGQMAIAGIMGIVGTATTVYNLSKNPMVQELVKKLGSK